VTQDSSTPNGQVVLETTGVSKHFLGVTALQEVDIVIREGDLVSLIGPNGSGKTTLFNCVTGFLKPDEGRVIYQGRDITGEKPHRITLLGITRTFQDVRIFPSMTVLESMLTVVQQHQEDDIVQRLFRTRKIRRFESEARERAQMLLGMVELTRLKDEPAGSLSYGQRKLMEFAAALMPDPDLIMLDEPTAAINPTMIERMKGYIRAQNEAGKTILIVEHNMEVVMDLSKRVIVLDAGQKIAEGPPHEIQRNERVVEAYFGR
jgi:ABC-type branched-subunit amino acid transport system ATPase component